ncbi:MAG: Nif3-like dinuclear metal center hexameric protein [Bacteroidales bacterium]
MLLKEFLQELETIAPSSLQESYDNSGLQVGDPGMELTRGLICLDVTQGVIAEAIQQNCNLVISHHPLIFKGLKRITGQHYVDKIIMEAIKNDIAIVSVHTNLDNLKTGVNFKLASMLGLKNIRILDPRKGIVKKLVVFCPVAHAHLVREAIFKAGAGHIGEYSSCSFNVQGSGSFRAGQQANPFVGKINELHFEPEERIETVFPAYLENNILQAMLKSHPYEEVAYDVYSLDNAFDQVGSGITGELEEPVPEQAFLAHVREVLQVPVLKHSPFTGQVITKVALCGGSGSFLLEQAMKSASQAFITADVKYHQFFEPWPRLLLIDAGHYETEQFTKQLLYEVVNKKISKFALLISEAHTNPVSYF